VGRSGSKGRHSTALVDEGAGQGCNVAVVFSEPQHWAVFELEQLARGDIASKSSPAPLTAGRGRTAQWPNRRSC